MRPGGRNSSPAIKVQFGSEERWLMLDQPEIINRPEGKYALQFARTKVRIAVPIQLKEFKMETYPGTNRAASYASEVILPNGSTHIISMNEPLKLNGYTFYQAGFDNDTEGKPAASAFSVNYDPGRSTKYTGSLLMVLGMISMFYFKPKFSRKSWRKK
jgi:cytochrome c biogenesis protein ResB